MMEKQHTSRWVKLEYQPNQNWHPVRDARGEIITCDYAEPAERIVAQFPVTMVVEEKHFTMIQDRHAAAKALPHVRLRVLELEAINQALENSNRELREQMDAWRATALEFVSSLESPLIR